MKPAILVTSHPNTQYKDFILKDFGNFISQWGLDNYLFTNFPPSKQAQQEFKESHFLNYNPECPLKDYHQWLVWVNYPSIKLKHNHLLQNWCFSGSHLMLEGLKYLQSLGYSHVYTFIYDTQTDWQLVNNFIELSNQAISNNKKALFYEYPILEVEVESQTIKRKGLHNHIYSGEINFLVKLFQELIDNYNKSNLFLQQRSVSCESYWRHSFKPYEDQIIYLPNSQVIKSVYESAALSELPGGYIFTIGRHNNKTLFVTLTRLSNFSLLDSDNNEVEYNITHQGDNLTSFEFNSIEGESYYLNNFLILTDTQNWRNSDFYQKI